MLEWSPSSIKGTIGAGGIGILMLSIPSLDAMHVHFWVAFAIALLPALVFIMASPGLMTAGAVSIAQRVAVAWYGLVALFSLSVAIARGFGRFELVFLGFVLLGAWPCVLTLRPARADGEASAGRVHPATLARRRDVAARLAHGGAVVFRASRRKGLLLLAGSIVFVALGLWARPSNPWLGWACIIFFGCGVVAAIGMLLPGSTSLRVDAQGLEMTSFFRSHRIGWDDVDGFAPASVGGRRMIAIAYGQAYARQRSLRRASKSISGVEGAIPDHYDAPAEVVLDTLLAAKARSLAAP